MMVAKKLCYDPTLVRYTEPYMDDNDAKNTGGKYRMIPIFEKAVTMAVGDARASRSWWAAASTARPSRTARRRSISSRWSSAPA